MKSIYERIPHKTRLDIAQGLVSAMFRLLYAYAVVIVCALTQGFARGNTVPLLVGSVFILLGCAFNSYNVLLLKERTRTQMVKMVFIAFPVAVGFLFNVYVTFYCGAWSLISLFWSFSFPNLFRGVAFAVAGACAIIAGSELMQIENFAAHQVDAAMGAEDETIVLK